MAQRFDLHLPEEFLDSSCTYAEKIVVDSAGLDVYTFGEEVDISLSFQDTDKYTLCYAILGDEDGDWDGRADDWHENLSNPDYSDRDLENVAHAALRVLAERAA